MPSNAERLMSALAPVFGSGRDVVIDDPTLARMVESLRPLAHGPQAGDDAVRWSGRALERTVAVPTAPSSDDISALAVPLSMRPRTASATPSRPSGRRTR